MRQRDNKLLKRKREGEANRKGGNVKYTKSATGQ